MSNGAKVIIDTELVGECHKCAALAMADALKSAHGQLSEEQAEALIAADEALIEALAQWNEARNETLSE